MEGVEENIFPFDLAEFPEPQPLPASETELRLRYMAWKALFLLTPTGKPFTISPTASQQQWVSSGTMSNYGTTPNWGQHPRDCGVSGVR